MISDATRRISTIDSDGEHSIRYHDNVRDAFFSPDVVVDASNSCEAAWVIKPGEDVFDPRLCWDNIYELKSADAGPHMIVIASSPANTYK